MAYVEHHVTNDIVIGYQVRILFLCGKKPIHEIFLLLVFTWILHALHEALDAESGGYGEVGEFVRDVRGIGVLAEKFVELGDLPDLMG
jgi:hypothetical protein